MAAELGLEPRYHPPEGRVLPLDDSAKFVYFSLSFWAIRQLIYISKYLLITTKLEITPTPIPKLNCIKEKNQRFDRK